MRFIFTLVYLFGIGLFFTVANRQMESLEYDVLATSSDYNQVAITAMMGICFSIFGGIFIIKLDAFKPKEKED